MALIFCMIAAAIALTRSDASSAAWGNVVGLTSVAVWILTLLGGFGVGPMGALRKALDG